MKKILIIFLVLLFLVAGAVLYIFISDSEVTVNLDGYVYDLPFAKGAKFRVVQGYGGLFSHRHKAALDFDMPEGTPVCAARGGIVFAYKENSNEGGLLPGYEKKANYIIIRHEDGSFGCYWHLMKHGVVVKKGAVVQGQLIGYSGSTGFVWRPHLHFAVKRRLNYEMNSFVRTRFRTDRGIRLPERGAVYQRPGK